MMLSRVKMRERRWMLAFAIAASFLPVSVLAITTMSQGYTSSERMPLGSIVSIKKNTSDQVVPAALNSADSILGIVISADESLLSVTNGTTTQVQVATSGTVPVLVSDMNGAITHGDHITASPISGVGMKATGNVRVVGVAQSAPESPTKQTYKEKNGEEKTVMLGQVPVQVNVAYYFKEPDKTLVPSSLQNLANALAGKSVSALPIIVSLAIFIITLIIVVSIIYTMIRSSIISVGRNPMSQSAVYRDLIQMSALVLGILAASVITIYFVLTRL